MTLDWGWGHQGQWPGEGALTLTCGVAEASVTQTRVGREAISSPNALYLASGPEGSEPLLPAFLLGLVALAGRQITVSSGRNGGLLELGGA